MSSNSNYVELPGSKPQPVFTIPSNCLPRNSIFSKLRKIWKDQGNESGERRKSKDLAKMLSEVSRESGGGSVREQAISQWCTGSDNREPPWWVIMNLCVWTGHYFELHPHCVRILKVEDSPGPS
jgi:hypothetical protein